MRAKAAMLQWSEGCSFQANIVYLLPGNRGMSIWSNIPP